MQGYEKHKPALHFFKSTWKNTIETLSHKSEPIITTIKWKLPINVSTQACSYRNPAIVAKVLSGSWLPDRSHGTLIGGFHFMMLWTQPVLWMGAVLFWNVLCRLVFEPNLVFSFLAKETHFYQKTVRGLSAVGLQLRPARENINSKNTIFRWKPLVFGAKTDVGNTFGINEKHPRRRQKKHEAEKC